LRNTMHFVFCRSTLSTRRFTSSSGSGYFSSVSSSIMKKEAEKTIKSKTFLAGSSQEPKK